ncbi:uncharacterized protein LOC123698000 [Colias croceus]|uniref:uncharacterized protein LOC123698000 n=1 Tax=Colias crocea TaxID=72248 RepID=UPI001E28083B|nr:uncharacterized protein LOC123698000 [Colias croceus]
MQLKQYFYFILVDIDFQNAAGFVGEPAQVTEGQHVVHFLSHAMLFCVGALIEPHVVLTTASCVMGEKYKFNIYAGTHKFIEGVGISRQVQHLCIHKGYNHSNRWMDCSRDNIALLLVTQQFFFHKREPGTAYVLNRVRYGVSNDIQKRIGDPSCHYFGWGSRRNGYLIPLLIDARRVDVTLLPPEKCREMWNYKNQYLCIQQPQCKTENHGALCPDDLGTVLICSGYVQGIMTSRLIDRPCGVGFMDLSKYTKFLTCGVDDSRDVMDQDDSLSMDFNKGQGSTPMLATVMVSSESEEKHG